MYYEMIARDKTINLFQKTNLSLKLNDNPFEIDLLVYNNQNEHIGYLVVENNDDIFRFCTNEFIYLTYKDLYKQYQKPINHILWSNDHKLYFYISHKQLQTSEIVNLKINKEHKLTTKLYKIDRTNIKLQNFENS